MASSRDSSSARRQGMAMVLLAQRTPAPASESAVHSRSGSGLL